MHNEPNPNQAKLSSKTVKADAKSWRVTFHSIEEIQSSVEPPGLKDDLLAPSPNNAVSNSTIRR
jgi:hypothetical protein